MRLRSGRKGGTSIGSNAVKRGDISSKLHVLDGTRNLHLVLGMSGVNVHGDQALLRLVLSTPGAKCLH
jgi:hypothetical protein